MPLPRPDRVAIQRALARSTRTVCQSVLRCCSALRKGPRRYLVLVTAALTVLAIGAVTLLISLTGHASSAQTMHPVAGSVTSAVADIAAHRVSGAVIDDTSHQVLLTYRATSAQHAPLTFAVPADYMASLEQSLIGAGVPVTVRHPQNGEAQSGQGVNIALLITLVVLGSLAGAYVYRRNRRMTGRPSSSGDTRDGVVAVPETRFSDIAGCDEAVEELKELVMFLREPERFTRTGAKAPKGALLCGPPGTGKTLLARAVAGEAGVPMLVAAGSDFSEKYVGVGAQRVRQLFADARKHERAIIFIDEIDATARSRSDSGANAAAEHDQTLVALLAEMDGFRSSNVIVLAATNRPDVLDSALTRPGRLDRRIEVPNPDRRGRQRILDVHIAGKPMADDVNLLALARRTPGFSGAQLQALVNEACIDAVRRDLELVDQSCFDHAVATIAMGRARTSALITDHDRQITAWHEAGHTIAAYLQPDADDPVQVSIVPRGAAGGVTWMAGNDNAFLTRRAALAQLVTALAGRAAEEVLLDGEYTQGASGDLVAATNLARQMATQYGMTALGYRVHEQRAAAASAAVADVVESLLNDAYLAAVRLLGEYRAFLVAVAEALLDDDTLTLAELHVLADRHRVARHAVMQVSPPARGREARGDLQPVPAPTRQPEAAAFRQFPPTVAAAALLRKVRRHAGGPHRGELAPDSL